MVAGTIAAIAAIAIPRYGRAVDRSALDAAAARCVAEFEAIRTRAIAERRAIAVRFVEGRGQGRILIAALDGKPLAGIVDFDLRRSPYGAGIESTTFPDSELIFDARGFAASAGTVLLERGAQRRAVRVDGGGSMVWR